VTSSKRFELLNKWYQGERTMMSLQVVGRHVASDRMVSGAYKTEFGETDEISQCIKKVEVSLFGRATKC